MRSSPCDGELSSTDLPRDCEIDPEFAFDRYGLDSMAAVNITLKMEDWLDLELSPNLPFKYRSIRTLANHLSRTALSGEKKS